MLTELSAEAYVLASVLIAATVGGGVGVARWLKRRRAARDARR